MMELQNQLKGHNEPASGVGQQGDYLILSTLKEWWHSEWKNHIFHKGGYIGRAFQISISALPNACVIFPPPNWQPSGGPVVSVTLWVARHEVLCWANFWSGGGWNCCAVCMQLLLCLWPVISNAVSLILRPNRLLTLSSTETDWKEARRGLGPVEMQVLLWAMLRGQEELLLFIMVL